MSAQTDGLPARTIYCHSFDPAETDKLLSAVGDLAERLRIEYPVVPPVDAERLPKTPHDEVTSYLRSLLPGSQTADRPAPEILENKLILVRLSPSDPFVSEAKEHSPVIGWGYAIPRRVAVVWHDNPSLIWHETLHLLGAKDCYNRFGMNKCPEPRCLMRWFPMSQLGDGQLYLCGKNVRRIAAPPPPEEG
ncbi:MAG: hypothetical protein AAF907_01875 [Planctomycetota bacterium]